MTTQDLNSRLEIALKDYLALNDFISTGNLYDSIKFNSTWIDEHLDINLSALEYIEYLDEGNLVDDFFNLENTLGIIADFYEANLYLNLDVNL